MRSIGQALAAAHTRGLLPVVALLFAAVFWGFFWYPLRLLEQRGLSGLWATAVIYGAALGMTLPLVWRDRALVGRHPGLLILLAVVNGWCNTAFILAVIEGSVVRVMLLFYLSPLWTLLLGWALLHERPDRHALVVFGLAIAGAAVMLWEPHLGYPWPRDEAEWLALTAGVCFAISNVLVRRAYDVPVPLKTAACWWGVVVLSIAWIVIVAEPLPSASSATLTWVFLIGGVSILCATLALQYGVTHLPAHRSAVILLFELVAGAASAYVLAGEVLRTMEWMGGAMIMVAGWIAAREGKA